MALKRRDNVRMRQMKHVVTHKSNYDQFMDLWGESPFTVTMIVLFPIALVVMGLHWVWVGIKSLFGFG